MFPEAGLDVAEHSPTRQHGDVGLERDTRSHVAEAQAFVSGSGGVDSSTDAALLMVVGLSGALEQREPVRLRTGVGTQEHAGQRLLVEHVEVAYSLTRLVHVHGFAAAQENLVCCLALRTGGHLRDNVDYSGLRFRRRASTCEDSHSILDG